MTATLDEAKTALRIDVSDDDVRIGQFLEAANLMVAEASGVDDWTDHPNLVTAAVMLVVTWFDADDLSGLAGMPAPVVALIDMSRTGWVKS